MAKQLRALADLPGDLDLISNIVKNKNNKQKVTKFYRNIILGSLSHILYMTQRQVAMTEIIFPLPNLKDLLYDLVMKSI